MKLRKGKNSRKRRDARVKAFDQIKDKRAFTKPGSQNPHKGI